MCSLVETTKFLDTAGDTFFLMTRMYNKIKVAVDNSCVYGSLSKKKGNTVQNHVPVNKPTSMDSARKRIWGWM